MNPESRLAEIVSALEGAGIPCLVMGGHAVRFYGLSRNTIDFDLHLAPDSWAELSPRLAGTPLFAGKLVLEGPSWRPNSFRRFLIGRLSDGREEWLEFWCENHLLPSFSELYARREQGLYGGRLLSFLALPDLIKSKETERAVDWQDITVLEEFLDARMLAQADSGGRTLPDALSRIRSRSGFETALQRGLFSDAHLVEQALGAASLAITQDSSSLSLPVDEARRRRSSPMILSASEPSCPPRRSTSHSSKRCEGNTGSSPRPWTGRTRKRKRCAQRRANEPRAQESPLVLIGSLTSHSLPGASLSGLVHGPGLFASAGFHFGPRNRSARLRSDEASCKAIVPMGRVRLDLREDATGQRARRTEPLLPGTHGGRIHAAMSLLWIESESVVRTSGRLVPPVVTVSSSNGGPPISIPSSTAIGQDTRRTFAPRISPLFSSIKARFASASSYSWTSGLRGISDARRRNSRTSDRVTLATLLISFSSQR